MKIFFEFVVLPIIVALEVIGVSRLYPVCENSFWKLIILYTGVYTTYELYRLIVNYYKI